MPRELACLSCLSGEMLAFTHDNQGPTLAPGSVVVETLARHHRSERSWVQISSRDILRNTCWQDWLSSTLYSFSLPLSSVQDPFRVEAITYQP